MVYVTKHLITIKIFVFVFLNYLVARILHIFKLSVWLEREKEGREKEPRNGPLLSFGTQEKEARETKPAWVPHLFSSSLTCEENGEKASSIYFSINTPVSL